MRPYRGRVFLNLSIASLIVLLELVPPRLTKRIIDVNIAGRDRAGLALLIAILLATGVMAKPIEMQINHRMKGRGMSWLPGVAQRLGKLRVLSLDPRRWEGFRALPSGSSASKGMGVSDRLRRADVSREA